MAKNKWRIFRPIWVAELDFDEKTGDFSYVVWLETHQYLTHPITVLEGNAKDHDQFERNRARLFARRLALTLNDIGWEPPP